MFVPGSIQGCQRSGYGADEVNRVLAALPESDDASGLLREALRRLAVSG